MARYRTGMTGMQRNDLIAWAAGLAGAAVITLITTAAGGRLGAGLSFGAIVLVAAIVGRVVLEERASGSG